MKNDKELNKEIILDEKQLNNVSGGFRTTPPGSETHGTNGGTTMRPR